MKHVNAPTVTMLWIWLLASIYTISGAHSEQPYENERQPHIVVILVDDYGFGNVGYHTSNATKEEAQRQREIHTPNIDSLMASGILLDRHYSYKICSPSRSSLQSGRLAVHVNIENVSPIVHNASDPISGYAGIPRNMTGFAQKLRDVGYKTHMVGKWDAGMATPQHTPWGRGYDKWYGYYQHANNYWTKGTDLESTGELDLCLNHFIDFSEHNQTYRGGVLDPKALDSSCRTSHADDPECYEEHLFKKKGLEFIEQHNASHPMLYFHAFHLIHTPLNIPLSYLEKVDRLVEPNYFDDAGRRNYSAMVYYMDETVGKIVEKLAAKDMWDNTLLVFMADNGGPIYSPGSANNHPLKGGKFSDWEGGMRTNAFLSGGYLPQQSRGSTYTGLVSISDWYGVFCDVAGADPIDHAALEANQWLEQRNLPLLPPVDSVPDLWKAIISGNDDNKHNGVLHLSETSIIKWPYKLVIGPQVYSSWQGPIYPNCSSVSPQLPPPSSPTRRIDNVDSSNPNLPWFQDIKVLNHPVNLSSSQKVEDLHLQVQDCGGIDQGCLFNIEIDPTEHLDLASNPIHHQTLLDLQTALKSLNEGNFHPYRGNMSVGACDNGFGVGNYYGPWVDSQDFYTGPYPPETPKQKEENKLFQSIITELSNPANVQTVVKGARLLLPLVGPAFASSLDQCRGPNITRAHQNNHQKKITTSQFANDFSFGWIDLENLLSNPKRKPIFN